MPISLGLSINTSRRNRTEAGFYENAAGDVFVNAAGDIFQQP